MSSSSPAPAPIPISQIPTYIEKHLPDTFDVGTLASVAGLSRSHFGRLFKLQFGRTPHEEIIRIRVHRAGFLLATTNKKEVEIAALCGFSDETLLARWFRRVKGCAPGDVRLRNCHDLSWRGAAAR